MERDEEDEGQSGQLRPPVLPLPSPLLGPDYDAEGFGFEAAEDQEFELAVAQMDLDMPPGPINEDEEETDAIGDYPELDEHLNADGGKESELHTRGDRSHAATPPPPIRVHPHLNQRVLNLGGMGQDQQPQFSPVYLHRESPGAAADC